MNESTWLYGLSRLQAFGSGRPRSMSRKIRITLGIVILAISISLLVWGFAPARREVRTQPISPTELQLPAPKSFAPQLYPVS